MQFRDYDPKRDKEAVHRIWREIGWLREGQEESIDLFVEAGRALVAGINGEAECLVLSVPGTMRYLTEDLPLSALTSVATSRIARKQGLARCLTAQLVAADALDGAFVAGLGMFEQGFYNQLGFGTGGYEHVLDFDPADLRLKVKARTPIRIAPGDWEAAHAALLARRRAHGGCNLLSAELTKAEMLNTKNGFGLGYRDGPDGELTHYFWCRAQDVGRGPYQIRWMAFQSGEQFLELMALLKSLGDQVRQVSMRERPGLQFQDLLRQPFAQRARTERGKFESRTRAVAYWQMRMCNLTGCLALTHLKWGEVRFNLELSDPIERYLDVDATWRGVAGEYVVTLGPASSAEIGVDGALPTLRASVGAFTRLWLGVRPATGLAVTDRLAGPQGLLEELDWLLRLPDPKPDWDF